MRSFLFFVLFGTSTVNSSFPASTGVTKENCGNIRGWSMYTDSPQRSHMGSQVSDAEANKSENDLRLRNCCNFKGKCDFLIQELNKGSSREICSLTASCNYVDSGKLRIERTMSNGWKSSPYCQNFAEPKYGIPMSFCQGAGTCFQSSTGKDALLQCLNTIFDSKLDHAGFFSTAIFPYKSFSYKKRDSTTDMEIELTRDGKVVRKNLPNLG